MMTMVMMIYELWELRTVFTYHYSNLYSTFVHFAIGEMQQ